MGICIYIFDGCIYTMVGTRKVLRKENREEKWKERKFEGNV